jgi:hypothetical protein
VSTPFSLIALETLSTAFPFQDPPQFAIWAKEKQQPKKVAYKRVIDLSAINNVDEYSKEDLEKTWKTLALHDVAPENEELQQLKKFEKTPQYLESLPFDSLNENQKRIVVNRELKKKVTRIGKCLDRSLIVTENDVLLPSHMTNMGLKLARLGNKLVWLDQSGNLIMDLILSGNLRYIQVEKDKVVLVTRVEMNCGSLVFLNEDMQKIGATCILCNRVIVGGFFNWSDTELVEVTKTLR